MRLVRTAQSPAVVSSLLVWMWRITGRRLLSASTMTSRTGTWAASPVSTSGAVNTTPYTGDVMRSALQKIFELKSFNSCLQVMSLIGSTLSNGVMVDGGTDHLKRCLNNTVTMPDPCRISNVTSDQLLEEITGPVFSSLASWLETNDDGVCNVNGSDLVLISRVLLVIVALLQVHR